MVTFPSVPRSPRGLRAHWLRPDLLALPAAWEGGARLIPAAEDRAGDGAGARAGARAGDPVALRRDPARDGELPPHLHAAGWVAFSAPVTAAAAREAVRGRVVVVGIADDDEDESRPTDVTGVQLGALLDVLYPQAAASAPLGAVVGPAGEVTARVWAPTARGVALELLDVTEPAHGTLRQRAVLPAIRDGESGVWTVEPGAGIAVGDAYRWIVQVYAPSTDRIEANHVTDPYSAALTLNSTASVVADLADPALAPQPWRETPAPRPARQVDHLITELHVRDLSRDAAELAPAERGTYRAFTRDIPGTRHLRALADAGVTTVHLLPVFDIATVEEDRTRWPAAQAVADPEVLAALVPDSAEQQRLVGEANAIARTFNWGYDPFHVFAPEGSYAVQAHGAPRIAEAREMVGALHGMGLAVVLDQVYNHTHSCGQDATSVLCRIVPGYYSRLAPDGTVETSTCCPNVATERAMAQRWMVDAVVHWARHYRVDGFRFDLMGHHSRENMLAVRRALDSLTLADDGVDGRGVLLYGEGWNFGEVADDAQFVQARQGNLGGTSIATFSDRLRDAVDGGTPSAPGTLREPGFATGLGFAAHDDDGGRGGGGDAGPGAGAGGGAGAGAGAGGDGDGAAAGAGGDAAGIAALRERAALLLRLGLAGNLRNVRIPLPGGASVRGADVPYGGDGSGAGYAAEPDEVVTYVDAHDNETLYDLAVLKLPRATTGPERVRANTLALACVAWAQTPGFWHAGTELLRSKSLDHDSFDSGDWFNRIDWDGVGSTYGSGLPPAWRNREAWDVLRPLLADPRLRPSADMIAAARQAALAVARTRREVSLLRLASTDLIEACVSFPAPERSDVVVMLVDASELAGPDRDRVLAIDPAHAAALVVLNSSDRAVRLDLPELRGRLFAPAAALAAWAAAAGEELPEWYIAAGVLDVPPLAAAVLVEPHPKPAAAPVL